MGRDWQITVEKLGSDVSKDLPQPLRKQPHQDQGKATVKQNPCCACLWRHTFQLLQRTILTE